MCCQGLITLPKVHHRHVNSALTQVLGGGGGFKKKKREPCRFYETVLSCSLVTAGPVLPKRTRPNPVGCRLRGPGAPAEFMLNSWVNFSYAPVWCSPSAISLPNLSEKHQPGLQVSDHDSQAAGWAITHSFHYTFPGCSAPVQCVACVYTVSVCVCF